MKFNHNMPHANMFCEDKVSC